ncbi:MAG: cobalamin-binding domain-containing protein [Bacillota bacterium]|nr:MAG: cobalamin-binding domain-containing protein [Bacillota bacterium]
MGLMRLSTYHKSIGDHVTFVRGKNSEVQSVDWDRVYVSSLFTYELPKTVETASFYRCSVDRSEDLIVGGTAVTLLPDYVAARVDCRIVKGLLDKPALLSANSPPIDTVLPDYSLLETVNYDYRPADSYFCRATKGCIRKCSFCAVPVLEPKFGYRKSVSDQVKEVDSKFGPKQNLVLMDNNVLAIKGLERIIEDIVRAGFGKGATRGGRSRTVDFNQGIDARLVTPRTAQLLSTLALSPVRLAFDSLEIEDAYVAAVKRLADVGFTDFTNYVMFNYEDDPASFYRRLRVNVDLSAKLGVRITSFPMKFVPMNDITRSNIGTSWTWRYLRGIQCVLLATHGVVSPNPTFFRAAFGESLEEFLEIVSMPDRYIIYRETHKSEGAEEWRREFRALSDAEREEFLELLDQLHRTRTKRPVGSSRRFRSLLNHYYPDDFDPDEEWFEQERFELRS